MISIITPSFHQLDWLKLCAASIADQEGVDVEHIVQDAGTEGVGNMFEAIRQGPATPRYDAKLIIEKDAGMYDAVNRGLAKARGEICGYLNCDEQYLPGALGAVANFFANHPEIEVVFGDVILVDRHARPIAYRRTVLPTLRHVRLAHLNTATCATFFRRRLIQRGFHFDARWKAIGDVVWVEQLLRAKVRMATLHQPLAAFAFTGHNLGNTSSSAKELATWKGHVRFNKMRTAAAVIIHRLRKAVAGAYRYRHLDFAIYTPESPRKRQRVIAESVGFGWP